VQDKASRIRQFINIVSKQLYQLKTESENLNFKKQAINDKPYLSYLRSRMENQFPHDEIKLFASG
jgi:hypothetical protein